MVPIITQNNFPNLKVLFFYTIITLHLNMNYTFSRSWSELKKLI